MCGRSLSESGSTMIVTMPEKLAAEDVGEHLVADDRRAPPASSRPFEAPSRKANGSGLTALATSWIPSSFATVDTRSCQLLETRQIVKPFSASDCAHSARACGNVAAVAGKQRVVEVDQQRVDAAGLQRVEVDVADSSQVVVGQEHAAGLVSENGRALVLVLGADQWILQP